MISLKLQVLLILFTGLSLLFTLNLVKKYRLELKYSLLWVFVNIALLILSCFPKLLQMVSLFMGIELSVNALFFLGIAFSLMIIFSLTIALSKASEKIKNLTQEVGIMKEKLRNLSESFNQKKEDKK
ncbi:DUF2304 domain-containing protein [Paenibacillus sp. 32O-W]|uniref:DUF2304 domain-containing protein n=1 Tax=Paenibacillus sp. 32O-W TaxID=1695218 RepID=UPI0011A3301C|nr:DUF2304 domain-containing protein [Paenibacillus sp. 32O-W]